MFYVLIIFIQPKLCSKKKGPDYCINEDNNINLSKRIKVGNKKYWKKEAIKLNL